MSSFPQCLDLWSNCSPFSTSSRLVLTTKSEPAAPVPPLALSIFSLLLDPPPLSLRFIHLHKPRAGKFDLVECACAGKYFSTCKEPSKFLWLHCCCQQIFPRWESSGDTVPIAAIQICDQALLPTLTAIPPWLLLAHSRWKSRFGESCTNPSF